MNPAHARLKGFSIALGLIILIGTIGFMYAESLSLGDAVYFSIVTISTVGYGDVHPTTQIGKILAIILIIGGTGSFLGIAVTASEKLINKRARRMRAAKLNMLIGAFFGDVGTELLTYLSDADPSLDEIKKKLVKEGTWTTKR
jgi:voltage-gated potassium channel Kch